MLYGQLIPNRNVFSCHAYCP